MQLRRMGGRFCGLLLFILHLCSAAECLGPTFVAQAGIEKGNWQEFAGDGKRLIREQGSIPFAALEARLPCDSGSLALRGLVAQGDWDYSGVSSTGSALNTTSRRSNSELTLTYSYAASPRFEPFFSAGIWSTKRDIRSAGAVLGYPEEYRLYPLHGGLQWRPAVFDERLLLTARLGTALRPRVNVRLPGRDPLTLNLGRTRSVGLSAEWAFGKQVLGQWVLATSWEKTRIDASSLGVVTRDGVPTGIARQPRGELTRMQVSLMWRKRFE